MILGLDVSTSCIGWTLLSDAGEYVDIGKIELKKEKDFYIKCELFRAFLKRFVGVPLSVYVEEPVKAFASALSMAQTITLLQRFNAVCCYLVYHDLGVRPTLIMESSARKLVEIKIPKGVKGKEKKKFVLKLVQDLGTIPDERWSYKKTGNPKDWCFDMADSFVVAKAGFQQLYGLRQ